MNLLKYYQQYRDKWWALPLVLPALLLPVARWANTYTMLNGHMVFFVLSSPGAGAQPDDVFWLGGDPWHYYWPAVNSGPRHDA